MWNDLPLNCEDHPQALTLPNPFARDLLRLDQLPTVELFLGSLSPLQHLLASDGVPGWWCYAHARMIGSLRLSSLVACGPGEGSSQGHDGLTVVLNYGGEIGLHQGGQLWSCRMGDCVVLPGGAVRWSGGPASLVVFVLQPHRLMRCATAMAGLEDPLLHWTRQLQQGRGWRSVSNGRRSTLQQGVRQVLHWSTDLADISSALVDRLSVDELIHGLVAALLFEDLRREGPVERLQQRERTGRDGFDELLVYIRQHLDQPLNLTALERRSFYSRRALQYAFRDRLGCTATQWIRMQRLDLAHRLLQNPLPDQTVADVARTCGYRSPSLFSVEFRQRFLVRPSELLRDARQHQNDAAGDRMESPVDP
jgi:AraC-like DNA-binding protein